MKTYTVKNGDRVPALGLGTWKAAKGEVYQAVREALRIGYRHIDCAAIYANEAEIGQAFADAFAAGEVRREGLWVTSKLWNSHHRRDEVLPALKKTLSDLQLDYLDLYLIHWPIVMRPNAPMPFTPEAFIPLEEVPISETWEQMEVAQREGLTRHIGVSNFSVKKLADLLKYAKSKPEFNQVEAQPFLPQNELLSFCQKEGILLTAYSPLGSKDRNSKKSNEPDLFTEPAIVQVAKAHDVTPAQVLLAWAIQRDTLVIPKSVNPARMQQNLAAADLALTAADMETIGKIATRHRFIDGSFWFVEGGYYTAENLWDE